MKRISLYFLFYKRFNKLSLAFTALCCAPWYTWGAAAFAPLFWIKILSLAAIGYAGHQASEKEYYYFRNLGFSPRSLWGATLFFDFLIFLLLLTLVYPWR